MERTRRRRSELDVEVRPGSHMAGGRGNEGGKEEGGVCLRHVGDWLGSSTRCMKWSNEGLGGTRLL